MMLVEVEDRGSRHQEEKMGGVGFVLYFFQSILFATNSCLITKLKLHVTLMILLFIAELNLYNFFPLHISLIFFNGVMFSLSTFVDFNSS